MARDKELVIPEGFLVARKSLEHRRDVVLERFNEKPLSEFTDEELKKLHKDAKLASQFYNGLQLTVKVLANGQYGAMGSSFFRYNSPLVAADITAEGRGATKLLDRKTDEFFRDKWHVEYQTWFKEVIIQDKFKDITFLSDTIKPVDVSKHIPIYADTDSLFLDFEKVLNSMSIDYASTTVRRLTDLIEFVVKTVLTPYYNEWLDKYAHIRNLRNYQEFELEQICRRGIFVAKKKYALSLLWKDGKYIAHQKILKIGGLEVIKSGTPEMVKKMVERYIHFMLSSADFSPESYFNYGVAVKNEIRKSTPEDYAPSGNMTDYESRVSVDPRTGLHKVVKKSPQNRGIARYNNYIIENNLHDKYEMFHGSGRIRWIFDEDGEPFAWPYDSGFPEEIAPKTDINIMCEKYIFKPVTRLLELVIDVNLESLGSTAFLGGLDLGCDVHLDTLHAAKKKQRNMMLEQENGEYNDNFNDGADTITLGSDNLDDFSYDHSDGLDLRSVA